MTAAPGEAIRYIDGNAGGKIVTLVFTSNGINYAVGEPYEFGDIVMSA